MQQCTLFFMKVKRSTRNWEENKEQKLKKCYEALLKSESRKDIVSQSLHYKLCVRLYTFVNMSVVSHLHQVRITLRRTVTAVRQSPTVG